MQVSWGVVVQYTVCDCLLCNGWLQDTACTDRLFLSPCATQETVAFLGYTENLEWCHKLTGSQA